MIYRWTFYLILLLVPTTAILQIKTYNVVNLQKDTLPLIKDPTKAYIIILSNNNACRACFNPLNNPSDYLDSLLKEYSWIIRFVCRVEQNTGVRRIHINKLISEMPNIANTNNIFFDIYTDKYVYNKQTTDGLFGLYQINKTPAIVLFRPNLPVEVFSYKIIIQYFEANTTFSLEKMILFRDK